MTWIYDSKVLKKIEFSTIKFYCQNKVDNIVEVNYFNQNDIIKNNNLFDKNKLLKEFIKKTNLILGQYDIYKLNKDLELISTERANKEINISFIEFLYFYSNEKNGNSTANNKNLWSNVLNELNILYSFSKDGEYLEIKKLIKYLQNKNPN